MRVVPVLALAGFVLALAGSGWLVYEFTLRSLSVSARDEATRRLDLLDQTLEVTIERFRYLPGLVGEARQIEDLLMAPSEQTVARANEYLAELNSTAAAADIFVMNLEGEIIASSNWWSVESLIGAQRSERPYYVDAIQNGEARFYAVGLNTNVPGYFLARRISVGNTLVGVAVAKVNLSEIEALWWRSGDLIAVLDASDVAILSTRPEWRFRPLLTIEGDGLDYVRDPVVYGADQFQNRGLIERFEPSSIGKLALLRSEENEEPTLHLADERWLPSHDWRIISFTPLSAISRNASIYGFAASLATASVLLAIALLEQWRNSLNARLRDHDRLERRVGERTAELKTVNSQLLAEVQERRRAESELHDAQASLVQAAKLASLGQALAGVAHEISQPVAALATHLSSVRVMTQAHADPRVPTAISTMGSLTTRLINLTDHLRTFARRQSDSSGVADVQSAIEHALEICGHKLRQFDIGLRVLLPHASVEVDFNEVHLEQVLINLISNAADAMEGLPLRELTIEVRPALENDRIEIIVSDTGTGVTEGNRPNLFDPFYTTKEPGRGLGLGLSISYSLVREANGVITLGEVLPSGCSFQVQVAGRMKHSEGALVS